jgi:hypothetical protein
MPAHPGRSASAKPGKASGGWSRGTPPARRPRDEIRAPDTLVDATSCAIADAGSIPAVSTNFTDLRSSANSAMQGEPDQRHAKRRASGSRNLRACNRGWGAAGEQAAPLSRPMLPTVPVIRCPLWDRRGPSTPSGELPEKPPASTTGLLSVSIPIVVPPPPGRNLIVGTQRFDRGNGRGLGVAHHAVDDQRREHASGRAGELVRAHRTSLTARPATTHAHKTSTPARPLGSSPRRLPALICRSARNVVAPAIAPRHRACVNGAPASPFPPSATRAPRSEARRHNRAGAQRARPIKGVVRRWHGPQPPIAEPHHPA